MSNTIAGIYASAKLRERVSLQQYSNVIKKRFEGNDSKADRYIGIARSMVNNDGFSSALTQAVEKLPLPKLTNKSLYAPVIQNMLLENTSEYAKLTDQLKTSLRNIANTLGTADLDNVVPGSDISNALDELFESTNKNDRVITLNNYNKLGAAFRGQYRAMLSQLPSFMGALKGSPNHDTLEIIRQILRPIQTLTGVCSEYQVKYELEKVLGSLEKSIQSTGCKVSRVGDEQGATGGFRVGTSDISITLGEGGNMNFSVPNLGMSLKRMSKNLNAADKVNIQLKNTTYGALFSELDPSVVTSFYTIYANTRPVLGNAKQGVIPSGTLTQAYNHMKQLALVPALIGNASSDDLVCILAINNKAFTIFDLLDKLSDEDIRRGMIISPALSTKRKGAVAAHIGFYAKTVAGKEDRSRNIRGLIDKISASVKLNLDLNRFR